MRKLRLSHDLWLPVDAVTQRISILGRTRSGKSHTAGVLVEEVLKARQQAVIVDPKGDWWGLRSSADGKSAGLPITIMGGKRGDIPLEPTAGALIADIVMNEGASVILDLSQFESKAAEVRFMEAFLDRLYRRNERPILLVIDEADIFGPQKPEKNETTMLNRMETVCRRGGQRGIGVVLISQRSASIHKGCLSQTELMVAHQTTAPQDRKAIREWADGKGTEEQQKTLMGRLAALKTGMAVVWSPAWLDLFKEVTVRRKETFDSGATPRVGMRRRAPKILAPVDIERLRKHMAETIEKMRADDPRLLREEVARLKAELLKAKIQAPRVAAPPGPAPAPRVEKVEVPALTRALEARLLKLGADISRDAVGAGERQSRLEASCRAVTEGLARLVETVRKAGAAAGPARKAAPPVPARPAPAAAGPEPEANGELNPRQTEILRALAMFLALGKSEVPRSWVAGLAGVSHKSSGYRANVCIVAKTGHIEYGEAGTLRLTASGADAAGHQPAPSRADMVQRCMMVLSQSRRDILAQLDSAYPEGLAREDLAARVGKSATSSGFRANVGAVKVAGMAEYLPDGKVRRADWIGAP
jgi:hypothetical protein